MFLKKSKPDKQIHSTDVKNEINTSIEEAEDILKMLEREHLVKHYLAPQINTPIVSSIFTNIVLMKCFVILFISSFLATITFGQPGGETCATATVISAIPYVGVGNTTGSVDDYFASCQDVGNQGGAGEQVYEYTNGSLDQYVDLTLCDAITDYDSQLYVFEGTCTGTPVGCQEDGCQSPSFGASYNSQITAQLLLANTTYYFVIDGYDAGAQGNYQLNISASVGLSAPDSTNIPLIIINTNSQEIVDEPKINVDFKIINNGPGNMNHPTDPANEYNGVAGIEIRGSYSATLPQKPYGLETRDILGENNNIPLFNMPSENDWILLANYNDKTFLRNILAFDLFTKMGHYAPRTQLCEVVINDIYNGVYVFTEKIKRDKGRVDISKLDFDDNLGDSLTGGYIFKVDYWNGANSWDANYDNPNYPGNQVKYVYDYPDEIDITTQQQTYLQNRVGAFEDALWGNDFSDPIIGYREYINTRSFIDYFIVNELARNVDGFKKSRRFHKNKDNKNTLIYAGPVWDFDWAYKDTDGSMLNGSGWRHSFSGGTDVTPPGWYIRLIQDPVFANELACRYFNLRTTILDTNVLFSYIDSMALVMEGAQDRHFTRWPILGVNVGTPEIGTQPTSYAGEITKFKNWLAERIEWLDLNMPGFCPNVGFAEHEKNYWSLYPNPSSNEINIYAEGKIKSYQVFDITGKMVLSYTELNENLIRIDASEFTGVYIVKVILSNGKLVQSKFISH
jgi:hypothetical protein